MKLTKSLPVIKERNCSASLVLDCRTQRKNATEFPLAMRFTIERKFFYCVVGSTYIEKQFSDICNATKSASENYREQRMWRETIVPKYKNLLAELNKGSLFTYEMVRVAVTTGNTSLQEEDDRSFMSIWEQIIHDLKTNDGGARFTTGQNYEYALKSFRKIMGYNAITGFNISVAEIQKWKDGMHDGIVGKGGTLEGKISDTTAGIYLRCCRAVWNRCVREGYLKDVPYPFSNKKEKGLVSIPKSAKRRQSYLNVEMMTELYNLFMSRNYPIQWSEEYTKRAHYSLGLFLAQYLCNGFNMADAGRLTYSDYYYQTGGKAFRFNRKKTAGRSADGSEVIIPIIAPLQNILNEIAAKPDRGAFVFPDILKGAETEEMRRKYTSQENSNVKDRMEKICHEALHWDKSICPSGTWCRHSFATNLHNAGVDMDYISESMGHAVTDHAITQIYIEHYPLDIQMENNTKLLKLETLSTEREALLAKLSNLSTAELAKLLA
mgnify:CR=1 FL=1